LGDVLEVLKRKRLLENAIVMVYSDHGESFESWDQSLVRENDPLVESLDLKPRWGHGTSVVDVHQYEIILGMRRYGAAWPPQREINVPVSFEDVAPTVLDLLKIPNTARFDGKSLAPLLAGTEGAARSFDGRIRFTETEFEMPAGFVTQGGKVSPSQALDVVKGYRVDRHTGRVLLRQSVLRQLLQSRQYAAIGERHLVAAVPNHDGPGFEYVGLDLDGGPIRQLADAPSAEEPELRALWAALHVEFADVLRDGPQSVAGAAVADPERKVTRDVTK
jgi:hypothetical protein